MAAAGGRDRLHGFDAVRGLAAVAVVALHAGYPYMLAPLPGLVWPVPLDEPSGLVDACFWAIEGFIMPLFFTISGYFLARSLARQQAGAVAANRSRRLVVAFWTVGIVILASDLLIWTAGFVITGQATWHDWRRMKFGPAIDEHLWGPGHLWYVWYLCLLCATFCLATATWQTAVRQFGPVILFFPRLTKAVEAVESPRFLPCLVGLSLAVFAILGLHPEIVIGFQHHFIVPAWPKFLHGGVFMLLGVALSQSAGAVDLVRKAAPFTLLTAVGAFVALLPRMQETATAAPGGGFDAVLGGLLALYAMTAVLGCLGAGLRWLDRPVPSLERLAAASFWVYVVHHPVCGLLQLALRPVGLPPAGKFAVVTAATLGFCLLTYGWVVENTAIGRLLDGEWPWKAFRRPQAAGPPAPEPATPRKAA